MSSQQSVTFWISQLRDGELHALQKLWERYSDRLIELARLRLGAAPKQIADEHDIVNSVFHSLCRGAQAGRIRELQNRDELWWLLLAIAKRRIVDHMRRETAQKRGAGRVVTETNFVGDEETSDRFQLDQLVSREPTPDFVVALGEEHDRLLGGLRDERLRQVATMRIEGYTVEEIAERIQIGKRSVERKLELIRRRWAEEIGNELTVETA
jgi:RNA polymerase sigma factor (sigma-70 family)